MDTRDTRETKDSGVKVETSNIRDTRIWVIQRIQEIKLIQGIQ